MYGKILKSFNSMKEFGIAMERTQGYWVRSMKATSVLHPLKTFQLVAIVDVVVKEYDNQVRVGFVGYRDYCDNDDRIVTVGLTEDTSQVLRLLSKMTF